jgi:hypothetical protein
MIDSKSLFYTAHHLLKQVQQLGNPENWIVRKETVQCIHMNEEKFSLMVVIRPESGNEGTELKNLQGLDQESLVNAAHELIRAEPKPTGYDFFKKDVQLFTDQQGNKFVLGVALGVFENQSAIEI